MKRSKGMLSGKNRNLARDIKRVSINQHFKTFKQGELVFINIKPKNRVPIPNVKFNKKHGIVVGKKGNAYTIKFKDGKKDKFIDILPIHLEFVSVV